MKYIINETQHRQDGEINVVATVVRGSFASGLSYYHDRIAKNVVDENFASVDILLTDEAMQDVENGYAHIHDGIVEQR